jgi:hypothetical protein
VAIEILEVNALPAVPIVELFVMGCVQYHQAFSAVKPYSIKTLFLASGATVAL